MSEIQVDGPYHPSNRDGKQWTIFRLYKDTSTWLYDFVEVFIPRRVEIAMSREAFGRLVNDEIQKAKVRVESYEH